MKNEQKNDGPEIGPKGKGSKKLVAENPGNQTPKPTDYTIANVRKAIATDLKSAVAFLNLVQNIPEVQESLAQAVYKQLNTPRFPEPKSPN